MDRPYYRVNGIDMVPFLIQGGIVWADEDIDGSDSGRTMDGVMHRELIATKDKHTLRYRELDLDEIRYVKSAFTSQYVTVETNFHPGVAGNLIFTMYNSSRKAATSYLDEEGNARFVMEDISLIER